MNSVSEKSVSHSYYSLEDTLKPLAEGEEISIVMYIAEKGRRKPRLLRRVTSIERIDSISRIDYPFLVKRLRENYAVVFDLFRDSVVRIEYYDIVWENIDREVNELGYLYGRDFLDKLVSIEKISRDIASFSGSIDRKEIVIENIVLNPDLVNELSCVFNKTTVYTNRSLKLPVKELSVEKYVNSINELINSIAHNHSYIMNIINRIDKHSEKYRERVSNEYMERISELERKMDIVRGEVKQRIEEINIKLREEVERKRREYDSLITSVESKIRDLEIKLKTIEEEERRVREYGGDLKSIRKRKKDIERELKEMSRKHSEYLEKRDSDIRSIEDRYSKLIESERNRVKEIEDQVKRVNEELENLVKLCSNRVESIKGYLLKYIDYIKSIEKKVIDSLIPLPIESEGVYRVPIYVVKYSSARRERWFIVPPLKINLPTKLRSLRITYFEKMREYLITIAEVVGKNVYKQLVSIEYNLFRNTPLERIENSFSILVSNGVISSKEYGKVIENIRKQISLIK